MHLKKKKIYIEIYSHSYCMLVKGAELLYDSKIAVIKIGVKLVYSLTHVINSALNSF